MPQDRLNDALDQLVTAELIFRRPTAPDAEYTFKHALVQDAAYSTLLRSRRQQIHARILTALETQFPGIVAAQPQLLAQHCIDGGLTLKAVSYLLKAGRHSTDRSAMAEAEAHLRKGLELLARLPDEAERQQFEADFQLALAVTLLATQGYAAQTVVEAFSRARSLCERFDRPSELATILVMQCGMHTLSGELALACQEAEEILELGEACNIADVKFQGYAMGAVAWFHAGDLMRALASADQALALYDPSYPSLAWWPHDPHVMSRCFVFRPLTHLGYLDQARLKRDEALAHARQRMHVHTLAMTLSISLETDNYIQSDPVILLRHAEELIAHCSEHGFPYWMWAAKWHRGAALLALGRTEEALEALTEALAVSIATGSVTVRPNIFTSLADAFGKAGQPMKGLEQLDEAARQIVATQERWKESDMHRVRGELLSTIGNHEAAEQSFHQAMAVARQQSARLRELRAASSLARLWRDQGKRTEARDLLAPIYGWFTEGFDTPVLQDAKALLDQLA